MSELVFNTDRYGHGSGHVCSAACGWCSAQPSTNQSYNASSAADATQHAGMLTLKSGHVGAGKHMVRAMESMQRHETGQTVKSHLAAAKAHEDQALRLRRDGYLDRAHEHDTAAAAHRSASRWHQAEMPAENDREALHGRQVDEGANATLISGPVRKGQGRGDVGDPASQTNNAQVQVAPSWNDPAAWNAHVERTVAEQVARNNHVDEIIVDRSARKRPVVNASEGPREIVEIRPPMITPDMVSPGLMKHFGITINGPLTRDQGRSEVSTDDLYDSPPMKGPGRGPSFDDRDRSPRAAVLRAGMTDDMLDDQEIDPLERYLGNPEEGEEDRDSTNAARMGFRSDDSHEDTQEYGEVIRSAARNQALAAQEQRQWNAALPGGRPVANQNTGALNAADNASPSLVAYFRSRGQQVG